MHETPQNEDYSGFSEFCVLRFDSARVARSVFLFFRFPTADMAGTEQKDQASRAVNHSAMTLGFEPLPRGSVFNPPSAPAAVSLSR
jgi:hypothetical protein